MVRPVPFEFSAAYEALNPDDADYRFYSTLADDLAASRVADLGCGTGVLASSLAAGGREVVGVDPDAAMLRIARARPGGKAVRWVQGYATDLPTHWADLIVMSGHVAQVFLTEDDWALTLSHLRRALRDGATLAFEMRDPAARAWEDWTRAGTLRLVETENGPVEFWHETTEVALPLVTYATHTRNTMTGECTSDVDTLAFRDEMTLRDTLERAGLPIREVFGDWARGPVATGITRELIVLATAE